MPKEKASPVAAGELSQTEQDLLWHMQHGYALATNPLGGDSVLRLANGQLVRSASANRNTVKALEERGMIAQGKGSDPLKIDWRLTKK